MGMGMPWDAMGWGCHGDGDIMGCGCHGMGMGWGCHGMGMGWGWGCHGDAMGALDHASNPRLLWGQPCPERGAAARLGTPSPPMPMSLDAPPAPRAAAHPELPEGRDLSRALPGAFGLAEDSGLSPPARQGGVGQRPTPASAQDSGQSLAVPSEPCPPRGTVQQPAATPPPRRPFPPADLGEALTTPGRAPGSKLHAWPRPSSPKWA